MNISDKSSQFGMKFNVRLRLIDKKTKSVIDERVGSNRVTKAALSGIAKFIKGEFNYSRSYDDMNGYIPKYVALGTNTAGQINPGVSSFVSVMDTKLLSELKTDKGYLDRKKITQMTVENRTVTSYVKLRMKCYISEDSFVGQKIAEAGLFTQDTGDNCWARITFPSIEKKEGTVIDIDWEITIVSLESESQPYSKEDVDKSILRELYNANLSKDESKYTDDSWFDFQVEMSRSAAILSYSNFPIDDDGHSSVGEKIVTDQTTALENAINNLEEVAMNG